MIALSTCIRLLCELAARTCDRALQLSCGRQDDEGRHATVKKVILSPFFSPPHLYIFGSVAMRERSPSLCLFRFLHTLLSALHGVPCLSCLMLNESEHNHLLLFLLWLSDDRCLTACGPWKSWDLQQLNQDAGARFWLKFSAFKKCWIVQYNWKIIGKW